jgi:hypothetical protein
VVQNVEPISAACVEMIPTFLPSNFPTLLSLSAEQLYVNDTLISDIPDELASLHSLQVNAAAAAARPRPTARFPSPSLVLQLLVLSQGAIREIRLRELRRKILGRKVMFV